MDVTKIQKEVRRLRPSQRKKLTAWMVSEFPVLFREWPHGEGRARGEGRHVGANSAD